MTKTTKISLNELFELQETMYKSYKKTGKEPTTRYFIFNNQFFRMNQYDFACANTKTYEAFDLILQQLVKNETVDPNHVYVDLLDESEKVYYLTLEERGKITNYLHQYFIYYLNLKQIQSKKEINQSKKRIRNALCLKFDFFINEISTDNMLILGTGFYSEGEYLYANHNEKAENLIQDPLFLSREHHAKLFTKSDLENTVLKNTSIMESFGLRLNDWDWE